jgi:hypothetical protein
LIYTGFGLETLIEGNGPVARNMAGLLYALITVQAEELVKPHAAANHESTVHSVSIRGDHDGNGVDEVRDLTHKFASFSNGPAQAGEIGMLEVSYTPMDHALGIGRGGTSKILTLEECHRQTATCPFTGKGNTLYPSTHNYDIIF